ncbi:MAG: aldo/keto reductase [Candidatus Hydrogenedentes bacterium]|nr:aldo/keto reductase [Candidatus Hydrogenedentota bacterium]
MSKFNRRSFMKGTAGALAAASLMSGTSSAATGLPKATDMRTLGNTGLKSSYLGMGTGVRGRGRGITDQIMKLSGEEYVALLEHAYQQGIRYFDLADQYGSHNYMRVAMSRSIERDKIMLLTKIPSREANVVKSDLERIRKELATDCIDVVLIHCLGGHEKDWPDTLKATMDVYAEAKAKGWIRAHGVSCHNLEALARVADEPWADVVLARINPFSRRMDGPTEQVVPVLEKIHKAGKGVLGMKILGEGDPEVVAKMDESLRFVGELGSVDAMTIGFLSKAEIDDVVNRMASLASA